MIKHLKISHFKSIREMELDCKRVNVFIGEPNKGKTNILEGIALFSHNLPTRFQDTFRFSIVSDLFYNFDISKPIDIQTNDTQGQFFYNKKASNFEFHQLLLGQMKLRFSIGINGNGGGSVGGFTDIGIRFYNYNKNLTNFKGADLGHLSTPDGDNLPLLIYSHKDLRKIVSDFLKEHGYRLNINPVEREILLTKEENDELYNFKYSLVSETIKRIVFLMLAIESNKNSTLLFDEPEAHTFPFYTKYIAERIALDTTNQYFLTTHNPYLLSSIISKTPTEDLSVGVVYMDNYETKVRVIQPDQYEELTDADVFYNLEHLTEA